MVAKELELDEFPEYDPFSYPWERWFNGSVWRITSEDWQCAHLESFRSMCHTKAREWGLGLRTHAPEGADGDVLIIQAYVEGSES